MVLNPTPMLRPSPLDIPGLFSGTFAALRQRFGLFILIALLPFVVAVVLIGSAVAVALAAGLVTVASNARGVPALPAGVLLGAALFVVGILATVLAQLKSQALMTVAAYDIAQGGRPDLRGLLQRTRGFLPRMAPVILLVAGIAVVLYGTLLAVMFGAVGGLAYGGRNANMAALGLFGVVLLLFVLLVPLAILVQTKLLYTIPAVAIEQLGGIDGMKRSWRLTKGEFWRTLGYYLLASMAVAVLSYIVSFVGQLAMIPLSVGLDRSSNLSEVLAQLAALVPVAVISIGAQILVQLIATPFLQAYITYMFVDQVRRSQAPAYSPGGMPPAYGQNPGPQRPAYPPPGQYYGQPGPGYPPPGQGPQQGQWPPAGGQDRPPQN